jgi:hypothetical protein
LGDGWEFENRALRGRNRGKKKGDLGGGQWIERVVRSVRVIVRDGEISRNFV